MLFLGVVHLQFKRDYSYTTGVTSTGGRSSSGGSHGSEVFKQIRRSKDRYRYVEGVEYTASLLTVAAFARGVASPGKLLPGYKVRHESDSQGKSPAFYPSGSLANDRS